MSQHNIDYSLNPTGPQLLDDYLAKDHENCLTTNSGIQRPSYAQAGTMWVNTSTTPWILNIYDGSNDVAIGTINPTSHEFISSNFVNVVNTTTAQNVGGVKTFTSSPVIPTPSTSDNSTKSASTAYVQNNLTGAISTVKTSNLAANRALISNGNGKLDVSATTNGELGYLSGVTSNIQTQFNGKAGLTSNNAFTGTNTFTTQANSDNSTKAATTAYVNNKLRKVNSLPANPDANTWYAIPEA